jgi:hypothetical protein
MKTLEIVPENLTKETTSLIEVQREPICVYKTSAERENNLKPLSERSSFYACLSCIGTKREAQYRECEKHVCLRREN